MSDPNFQFAALKDAQGKLDAARKRQAAIFTEAGADMNLDNVKTVSGSRADKIAAIQTGEAEMADLKKEVEGLRSIARAAANPDLKARETDSGPEVKGDQSFRALLKARMTDLRENKHRTQHLDIETKTLFERTAGWAPESLRSGRVELTALRPAVQVTNYIPSGTISQATYKFMLETTHTASNVVEKAEGATFGEAALALTEQSQTVEKIPAWIPVTDEQLEDEPAALAYVESRLTQMIQRRLDAQVLTGDGSTPNLKGTENVGSIQTQAKGVDSTIDAAYKLFTLIRSSGFAEPSVAFINPTKWQDVALTKTADGQYVWNHPAQGGPESLWGVPVVQTTAHTSTKLVTGDYATYSMLFLRRGMDVQVTNSHSTDFINGKQAIRADIRVVMVHFRPGAFGVVTGL